MSIFLDILNNHRELLQERGYDEIGLGSPDEPGLFMRKLEYLFSECIRKAEYEKEKQDFFIEAFGFFDNDNDLVTFKFHYEFDPSEKDIELKSLSTRLNDYSKVFLFSRNTYELPFASRVHQMLSTIRDFNSLDLNPSKPDIEKMINEQETFLEQFGYYQTHFGNPPNFIRNELRSELEKIADFPVLENQSIYIDRFLHFNQYEFIQCSFHYQYNPVKPNLHLESITARKNNIEKHFLIGKGNTTVSVQQIYQSIKDLERLQNAKEISNHVPKAVKRIMR